MEFMYCPFCGDDIGMCRCTCELGEHAVYIVISNIDDDFYRRFISYDKFMKKLGMKLLRFAKRFPCSISIYNEVGESLIIGDV